ncbi:hypothetical protein [Streptomyces sp. NPDC058206]|uniref:hypothetical protein n=1 Tax=Streptomyces sp. NPDC058206 TaxID=3346382 RepID=UPI0036DFEC0D
MSEHAYQIAHKRVVRLYGAARNHPCTFCFLAAKEWALDNEYPDIVRDENGLAYADNPSAYMPLCFTCHRAYDAFVRENGPDPVGIIRLRQSRFEAVGPETRTVALPGLLATFKATQLWLNSAVDMVDTRVNTFDEPLPVPVPVPVPVASAADWFADLFILDESESVLGTDAHAAYVAWFRRGSYPPRDVLSRNGFYRVMEAHGVWRKKTNRGIAMRGLRLRSTAARQAA